MSSSVRVPTAKLVLTGTPVVPGVVAAPAVRPGVRLQPHIDTVEIAPEDRDTELDGFRAAADTVAQRLRDRSGRATGAAAEVLAANAAMAEDRGWRSAAEKLIGSGSHAVSASAAATEQFAAMFTKLGGLMAERVTDLHDVRDRVIAELLGVPEPGVPTPDVPSVLLADDLAPADTAGLDPSLVIGLATTLGGPTSHTAIIARQLGIPCVVAVSGLDNVDAGVLVLLDGSTGDVSVAPDPAFAAAAVEDYRVLAERSAGWQGPGATADGHAVDVLANVQDGAGARAAAETAADGVGLFRTELSFLNRETEPSVEEQARIYGEVLAAFPDSKVVLRTLDAGSDKPLKFADHPDEANPALGVRGIRIAVGNPGLLDRQLDAIAVAVASETGASETGASETVASETVASETGASETVASEAGARKPWVMAPMISTAAEAASFAAKVRSRDLVPGVMIEVPAAALLADRILTHVDFLSIGTNDLAQYTMAADRMSSDLAALTDPWQPAVLALVARTAAAGVAAGKPVGVCGEAAADPLLACVLVGFGITSLSAAASAVAAVGAKLATVTLADCRTAAAAALETADPGSAREVARRVLG